MICSHVALSAVSSGLKSAQLSRAAAQAVRLSTRQGAFADALYVVNSLHLNGTVGEHSSVFKADTHMQAPTVVHPLASPRLSAHCLLHALLRSGRAQQAARFSETMMMQGVQVHSRTLQCVVRGLCRPLPRVLDSAVPTTLSSNLLEKPPGNEDELLSFVASRVHDPCCRAAIRILDHAKRYGQYRNRQMYDALINACLLQGEIIVASLLFVLLVKEFTVKPLIVHSPACEQDDLELPLRTESSHLSLQSLKPILRELNAVFLRDPRSLADETRLRCSTQALANMVMLLNQDEVLSGNISLILRALYSYPKTDVRVWVLRNGKSQSVVAYPYFQRVLAQIIWRMKQGTVSPLPHLDLRSYNALLFYALRHRLSPAMGSTVLEHMSTLCLRPFQPSIVTYNILLRSATLLRLTGVAETLLAALNLGIPSAFRSQGATVSSSSTPSSRSSHDLRVMQKRKREVLRIPEDLLAAFTRLKPDMYTLTTYICHLTSTGHPHEVQELLYQLLPELRLLLENDVPPSEKRQLHKLSLKRAVIYGPYFFTAVMNALVKAGLTGTAERVWILAQQAQYASRIPGFAAGVEAWSLSIPAYTILMQCYAAEASKSSGTSADSRTPLKPKHRVCGYGRFTYTRKQLRTGRLRYAAGYRLGILLFRTVVSGSRTMYKTVARTKGGLASAMPPITPPVADARFYNATLDVVQAGRKRGVDNMLSIRHGSTARSWQQVSPLTPLQQVVGNMLIAGYTLPTYLQNVAENTQEELPESPRMLDRTPYAFRTPQNAVGSKRLPVSFSRSLSGRTRTRR